MSASSFGLPPMGLTPLGGFAPRPAPAPAAAAAIPRSAVHDNSALQQQQPFQRDLMGPGLPGFQPQFPEAPRWSSTVRLLSGFPFKFMLWSTHAGHENGCKYICELLYLPAIYHIVVTYIAAVHFLHMTNFCIYAYTTCKFCKITQTSGLPPANDAYFLFSITGPCSHSRVAS